MAKQLFNTSDKSNFILNLTEEKYSKMAAFGLLTACFAVSAATILPETAREFSGTLNTISYAVVSGGLALTGVICMILAFIAMIKKYITVRQLVPVCALTVMVGWGAVSLIFSYDYRVALYGFDRRGEGLLAILYYFGFFVTAASVRREKALNTFITGIIGAGLLNSVWGLIQVFTGKLTFYNYKSTYMGFSSNPAAGLSQSPIFLAMVLCLALTAALIRSVMSSSKRTRIICTVCACLFSFTMLLTYSLAGIVGVCLGVISAAAAVFIVKADKKRLISAAAPIVSAALAIVLAAVGAIGNESSYALHDGHILWSADSFQRVHASGTYDPRVVDITDTFDVYSVLNRKTVDIIKEYPLVGTGPEQLVYPQLYTTGMAEGAEYEVTDIAVNNPGTFDKVYNEYLYTAATRGIPSLLALIAAIAGAVYLSYKNMKKERSEVSVCLFFVTVCGALIYLIGCSNITFAPIFWAAAGGACAEAKRDKAEK